MLTRGAFSCHFLAFSPSGLTTILPPTSLPKDGRQNLQESENLIYLFIFFLKERKNPSCVARPPAFPHQKEAWILKDIQTWPEISLLKSNENQWKYEPEQIHYMLT